MVVLYLSTKSVLLQTDKYSILKNDYNNLQEKFLALQEGRDSVNSTMIRKYKSEAERLTNNLSSLQKRFDVLQSAKDQQYDELQGRIDELSAELSNKTNFMKEKLESDHKVLEARKLADRLNKQIASSQKELNKLQAELDQAKTERDDLNSQITDYCTQAALVAKTLSTAQKQLDVICQNDIFDSTKEPLHLELADVTKSSALTVNQTLPLQKPEISIKSSITDNTELAKKEELKNKHNMFMGGFRKSVASFLGFL